MTVNDAVGGRSRNLILAAMIFAASMTFIDQTIVSIAAPKIQRAAQQWYIILSGAGMGFMLGPSSRDAVNPASRLSYGEATGITQTVRNYAWRMLSAALKEKPNNAACCQ
jgi:hypothetical protein